MGLSCFIFRRKNSFLKACLKEFNKTDKITLYYVAKYALMKALLFLKNYLNVNTRST